MPDTIVHNTLRVFHAISDATIPASRRRLLGDMSMTSSVIRKAGAAKAAKIAGGMNRRARCAASGNRSDRPDSAISEKRTAKVPAPIAAINSQIVPAE